MAKKVKSIAVASLTLMLAACLTAKAEPTATVRGEATYRERIAVPPGAQLEVPLLDVSRAGSAHPVPQLPSRSAASGPS
jgi:putative lipoprotein